MAWKGRSSATAWSPIGNQAVEFALVGQGGIGQGAGHTGHGHEQDGDDGATHGFKY